MKLPRMSLSLPLLLVLYAGSAAAQQPRTGAPVPFAGLGIGGSSLPIAFAGCSGDMRSTGELRAGVSFGTVAVEGRGAALLAGFTDCLIILPEEQRLPGTFPGVEYPFERSDVHTATELRVRYTPPAGLPLVLAGGAGWLAPQDVPYAGPQACPRPHRGVLHGGSLHRDHALPGGDALSERPPRLRPRGDRPIPYAGWYYQIVLRPQSASP